MKKIILNHEFPVCMLAVILFVVCGISICDAKEQVKFIKSIEAGLEEPIDIAVSPKGEMYALDKEMAKVMVFTKEGKLRLSFGHKGYSPGEFVRPQAISLMQNGNIVVADTGNSRIQVFTPEGQFAYLLGNSGSKEGEFKSPIAMASDPLWNLHVIDESKQTITKYSPKGVFLKEWSAEYKPKDIAFDIQGNMYVLYKEAGKILRHSASDGTVREIVMEDEDGNFVLHAENISVDHRGDIYLIGDHGHTVRKMNQAQEILFAFGSHGVGRGQFNEPMGVATDSEGQVYVADTMNKRLQVFSVEGNSKGSLSTVVFLDPILDFEKSIPSSSNVVDLDLVEGQGLYALSDYHAYILRRGDSNQLLGQSEENAALLSDPKALHVFPDGRMLVADTGNNQLKFLNSDGTLDYHFGRRGDDQSQFHNLEGVAVNSEGYIYIADTRNHRIQIFNSDGIYLDSFGKQSVLNADKEAEPGTFLYPKDLVFDSNDHLYVLDSKNKRIQVFNSSGEFLREIGGASDTVRFEEPVDLDIDENNYLYVADRGRHKICILNEQGKKVMEFGSAGQGPSHFPRLSSVKSHKGKIYVADYLVEDVKVFSFEPEKKPDVERIYVTKISKPLKMKNASEEIVKSISRKMTIEDAKNDLRDQYGMSEKSLESLEVEAEEILPGGQLKMTISVPKEPGVQAVTGDEMVSLK